MGYAPTQKRINWQGCALLTFENDLIKDVWVLGDLKTLEEQLNRNTAL
jgi:hypothetical protein